MSRFKKNFATVYPKRLKLKYGRAHGRAARGARAAPRRQELDENCKRARKQVRRAVQVSLQAAEEWESKRGSRGRETGGKEEGRRLQVEEDARENGTTGAGELHAADEFADGGVTAEDVAEPGNGSRAAGTAEEVDVGAGGDKPVEAAGNGQTVRGVWIGSRESGYVFEAV